MPFAVPPSKLLFRPGQGRDISRPVEGRAAPLLLLRLQLRPLPDRSHPQGVSLLVGGRRGIDRRAAFGAEALHALVPALGRLEVVLRLAAQPQPLFRRKHHDAIRSTRHLLAIGAVAEVYLLRIHFRREGNFPAMAPAVDFHAPLRQSSVVSRHRFHDKGPVPALTRYLPEERDTLAFGIALAARLVPGMVIYLSGELGAGKTTLARGILRGLGYEGRVRSPSFALVEPYKFSRLYLYHFDFYRFTSPRELGEAGFREHFGPESEIGRASCRERV